MMAKTIEIQTIAQHEHEWRNIHLSEVKYNDDAIVMGGPIRILVDGENVYEIGIEE